MCQLLRYLASNEDPAEEQIAADVYDRPGINTAHNPIVRVEMARLRQKLTAYASSVADPIVLMAPVRSYRIEARRRG